MHKFTCFLRCFQLAILVFLHGSIEALEKPRFSPYHETNTIEVQREASLRDRTPLNPTGPIGATMVGTPFLTLKPQGREPLEAAVSQAIEQATSTPEAQPVEVARKRSVKLATPEIGVAGVVEVNTGKAGHTVEGNYLPPGGYLVRQDIADDTFIRSTTYDRYGNELTVTETTIGAKKRQELRSQETEMSIKYIEAGARKLKYKRLYDGTCSWSAKERINNYGSSEFWLSDDVTQAYGEGVFLAAEKIYGP